MDTESVHEPALDGDPVRVFADRLRRLQADSGGPSVRDLVRLTDKIGSPYTRGTIHDKLAGRSVAPWEFVEAFVRACALHNGAKAPPDLRPWRRWHAQMARDVAEARTGRRRTVRPDVCPYRGLEPFTAEHAELFHGRSTAVQQIVSGLAAYRSGIVVLGPSGGGKSSVVQAGVLPALAHGALPGSDRWLPVLARPGKDLLAEVDRAGLTGAGHEPIATLVAHRLAGEPAGARVLLVIDQFEELLTPAVSDGQEAQRTAIAELTAAIGAPGLGVILVMRDDFYPRLASQAPELLRALAPALLNVPATLGTEDLGEIILRPARAVGLGFQDGLPERIITDVLNADPGNGPARRAPITVLPLLELTLLQLWHRREKELLTHDAYHRVGGISGALTIWCDTAVEQLPPSQRTIAQRVLTSMVRPADNDHHIPAVRQQVPLETLRRLADTITATGDEPPASSVDEVLAVLTDHRIVTTRTVRTADPSSSSPGVPVAELVHDALIRDWATLRDWVSQDHRFQDWLRRAEERYARWAVQHDPGDLLRGGELAEGLDWSARRRLPEHVAELLAASRHHQRAGVRRTRMVAAVLAVLLIAALAATGIALRQRQSAVAAQQEALSRQLAAQSTALTSADSDLAALLAVQAYRLSHTTEATRGLFTAAASPLLRRLNTGVATDPQSSAAVSRDGRLLATGGRDGRVRLWDLPGGHLRIALSGHTGPVWALAFSPDGRSLASGGADETIRLWNAEGRHLATLSGHTGSITFVHFTPDGHTLASGGHDGKVRLWDIDTRTHRFALPGYYPASFFAAAFTPDGRTVAVGDERGTIQLRDVSGGQPLVTLTGHTGAVNAVTFSPDGRAVASAGDDHTVRVWDADSGQHLRTLPGHTDWVRAVAFSPDGRTLASGSNDHTARLWDVAGGYRPRATLTGHTDDVNELTFSPDSHALITAGNDGTARLWNVTDGHSRAVLSGTRTHRAVFSPDSRILVTVGDSGARLWDPTAGTPTLELADPTPHVWVLAYSKDGRTLATGGGNPDGGRNPTIRLWDSAGHATRTLTTDNRTVTSMAFSPDGRTLASTGIDRTVQLWNPASGQTQEIIRDAGEALAISPDGQMLATGARDDGRVTLWNMTDGHRVANLEGHPEAVTAVAFSPDGRTLASTSEDRTTRLWDTTNRRQPVTLTGHTTTVESVAFSPDGRTVATGGWDDARLWDAASGQLRMALTGHVQRVTAVAFSPDGTTLATASADNTVRLWDVADGLTRTVIGGYIDAVTAVAFSPDGRTLLTASWRGNVKMWTVAVPTPAAAIEKICRTVDRDLTPQERSVYLPAGESLTPACP